MLVSPSRISCKGNARVADPGIPEGSTAERDAVERSGLHVVDRVAVVADVVVLRDVLASVGRVGRARVHGDPLARDRHVQGAAVAGSRPSRED